MLEKLSSKEILDIISKHYTEERFAYGEWDEAKDLPEDFEFSDELKLAQKEYLEKRDAYYGHPGFRDQSLRDESFITVQSEFTNCPSEHELKQKEILNYLGLGEIVDIEQTGGEGQGDHWHQVWYFKDHDVYIKIIGDYTSYHGTEFYSGYGEEVKPVEKIITVFE